jgi:hypothetical protein
MDDLRAAPAEPLLYIRAWTGIARSSASEATRAFRVIPGELLDALSNIQRRLMDEFCGASAPQVPWR